MCLCGPVCPVSETRCTYLVCVLRYQWWSKPLSGYLSSPVFLVPCLCEETPCGPVPSCLKGQEGSGS